MATTKTAAPKSTYGVANIKVHLKDTDKIRAKPGMYLGERGNQMIWRALKEIVDNGVDEFLSGRNKYVEVYGNTKTNVYIVSDQAGGIPVGIKKEKDGNKTIEINTLTAIYTMLQAGGKFDDEAYKKCFVGDTRIRLLDGTTPTLEELARTHFDQSFWVLSCRPDGDIVPGLAYLPRLTKKVRELVEVHLDNERVERCTPDHEWLLRNGEYREARDLKPGDSLMPIYLKADAEGRTRVHLNNIKQSHLSDHESERDSFVPLARLVYASTHPNRKVKFKYQVHHANGNCADDRPENLLYVHRTAHRTIHGVLNSITGVNNAHGGLQRYSKSDRGRKNSSKVGKKTRVYLSEYKPHTKHATPAANFTNHKVVKIKTITLDNPVPVYDISVDRYHNFLLDSGVVVHNSAGTHGVGAAATNAASKRLRVWTFWKGKWQFQEYKCGHPLAPVKVCPPPAEVTKLLQKKPTKGTVVYFEPDEKIVNDPPTKRAVLPLSHTASWLSNTSLMNKNLTIVYNLDGKIKELCNKRGVVALLEKRLKDDGLEPMGKPVVIETTNVVCAIQWSSFMEDDGVVSYVSNSITKDGGTHLEGFYDALTESLAKYKTKRDKYSPKDLRNGLVGVFNYMMSQPEFSSQTKDRLTSHVRPQVKAEMLEQFTTFFTKHAKLARMVIKRANEVKKSKEEFQKLMQGVAKVKQNGRGIMLPNILASAPSATPENRELYLVEGESAGGCYRHNVEVQLINGEKKTFKELVEDHEKGIVNYGYAHSNKTGLISVVPFIEPRIVKHTRFLTEVTLDNGEKIQCTRDHPWKLRTGAYAGAKDLVPGDSLMPLATDVHVVSTLDITLDQAVPVYDATVEYKGLHNYALGAGVFVHNTAKKARDNKYQEVLRLSGKPANAMKMPLAKLLKSAPIQNMLTAIGYDFKSKTPTTNLRIKRLFLLADADADGKHINVLILSLIYKLLPKLFDEGRIFVCDAPLFFAYVKGKRYFGETHHDCWKQLPKGTPKDVVVRAKGWGEIGPEVLAEIAFSPLTRKVIEVNPAKGKGAKYFESLTSSETEGRKLLLGL